MVKRVDVKGLALNFVDSADYHAENYGLMEGLIDLVVIGLKDKRIDSAVDALEVLRLHLMASNDTAADYKERARKIWEMVKNEWKD